MAERDIFNNELSFTGGKIVTSHNMIMHIQGAGNVTRGALVQNVVIQYSQPVQTLREVGSKNFYYFSQPPSGVVNFGRIVTEEVGLLDILPDGSTPGSTNIWDVPCEGSNPTILLQPTETECEESANVIYRMRQCIVENLGITVDANGSFIQNSVSIRFGNLLFE